MATSITKSPSARPWATFQARSAPTEARTRSASTREPPAMPRITIGGGPQRADAWTPRRSLPAELGGRRDDAQVSRRQQLDRRAGLERALRPRGQVRVSPIGRVRSSPSLPVDAQRRLEPWNRIAGRRRRRSAAIRRIGGGPGCTNAKLVTRPRKMASRCRSSSQSKSGRTPSVELAPATATGSCTSAPSRSRRSAAAHVGRGGGRRGLRARPR